MMICYRCGSRMEERITDLPFKLSDSSIVIIKGLPVTQCSGCGEYLLADAVMAQVEQIEELDSIRAYDAAKASGDEIIPFEEAVKEIEQNR